MKGSSIIGWIGRLFGIGKPKHFDTSIMCRIKVRGDYQVVKMFAEGAMGSGLLCRTGDNKNHRLIMPGAADDEDRFWELWTHWNNNAAISWESDDE